MPASRILRFARTSRCAIVASGTRNARAISGGGEPGERAQRERDLGLDRQRRVAAGEDQAQPVVGDAAVVDHRWWLVGHDGRRPPAPSPRRVCARRSRSSARLRAVVVSQAPGLRGTPSRGHRSSARANASCAHSSARSQSPVVRMRVATTRPHSSRNARATASSTSDRPTTSPRSAAPRSSRAWRRGSSTPPRWPRRGPCSRPGRSPAICSLVSANGPSDVSTSPSRTRTVVADGRGPEPLAALQHAAAAHLLAPRHVAGHLGAGLVLRHLGLALVLGADQQCVTHGCLLGSPSVLPVPRRTASVGIDTSLAEIPNRPAGQTGRCSSSASRSMSRPSCQVPSGPRSECRVIPTGRNPTLV